jgi:hypothetical protein
VAVAAPTVVLGSGCQTDDDELGFRVTKIEFDQDSRITVTFSEPIADFGGIDPNDFRLSFGTTVSATLTYQGMTANYTFTSYEDISYHLDGYSYYPMPFTFVSVTRGPAANQIVLDTSESLAPACDSLAETRQGFEMYAEYYESSRFDLAIFLHYASGEIPIESESGSPFEDVGAPWVLGQDLSFERDGFGFTMLIPPLRIPCS